MSTTEESAARCGADRRFPANRCGAAAAAVDRVDRHGGSSRAHSHDALSPAVRRLVRQFDLDITGIHGTGPEGRIRVGDVMGLLGGRTDTGNRDAPLRAARTRRRARRAGARGRRLAARAPPAAPLRQRRAGAARRTSGATTTVFDCDLSRVLSHRKQAARRKRRSAHDELYPDGARGGARRDARDHGRRAPEIRRVADDGRRRAALGVARHGNRRVGHLARRPRARVRRSVARESRRRPTAANLLVHHYGESGSLLATPTPIGAGHAASVGVGRVRREIVVRTVDGVEAPRVAARCYVTLSFLPTTSRSSTPTAPSRKPFVSSTAGIIDPAYFEWTYAFSP